MKMETIAKLNNLRMAPRKLRLLVDLVRGMNVAGALAELTHSHKVAALPLRKLIASAVANAKHNHRMEADSLVIKTIFVDGGPIMYRSQPRAFGRAAPIRKRTSHITVILEGDASEAPVQVSEVEAPMPVIEGEVKAKTKAKKTVVKKTPKKKAE